MAHEASHNLAVAAGPLVALAVGMLCATVRVCAAMYRVGDVAVELLQDTKEVSDVVRRHVLPAVVNLGGAHHECAPPLVCQVGEVAADIDAITGRLLHMALSRRAGARAAIRSRGEDDDLPRKQALSNCKQAVVAAR